MPQWWVHSASLPFTIYGQYKHSLSAEKQGKTKHWKSATPFTVGHKRRLSSATLHRKHWMDQWQIEHRIQMVGVMWCQFPFLLLFINDHTECDTIYVIVHMKIMRRALMSANNSFLVIYCCHLHDFALSVPKLWPNKQLYKHCGSPFILGNYTLKCMYGMYTKLFP